MLSGTSLAVLSAAIRIAEAGPPAILCIDFEANFSIGGEDQYLAAPIRLGMVDETASPLAVPKIQNTKSPT